MIPNLLIYQSERLRICNYTGTKVSSWLCFWYQDISINFELAIPKHCVLGGWLYHKACACNSVWFKVAIMCIVVLDWRSCRILQYVLLVHQEVSNPQLRIPEPSQFCDFEGPSFYVPGSIMKLYLFLAVGMSNLQNWDRQFSTYRLIDTP
jgi:hypothetical protein